MIKWKLRMYFRVSTFFSPITDCSEKCLVTYFCLSLITRRLLQSYFYENICRLRQTPMWITFFDWSKTSRRLKEARLEWCSVWDIIGRHFHFKWKICPTWTDYLVFQVHVRYKLFWYLMTQRGFTAQFRF